MYMTFLDLEITFDNVKWNIMFRILRKVDLKYNNKL